MEICLPAPARGTCLNISYPGSGRQGQAAGALEWTGPVIDDLSMGERFSLCSLALFTGAWTAIINPDQTTLDYVRARVQMSFLSLK